MSHIQFPVFPLLCRGPFLPFHILTLQKGAKITTWKWKNVVGCWLLVVGCWLLETAYRQPPTANHFSKA